MIRRRQTPGDSQEIFKDKSWDEGPDKSDLEMSMGNKNESHCNTESENIH